LGAVVVLLDPGVERGRDAGRVHGRYVTCQS
jgi:hypothetical protein